MSAAYESLSLVEASAVVDEIDAGERKSGERLAPPAPESGVKSVAVARERAFRAMYDAHVAFVWRNLRRLGVHDRDVEDKVQEVFVVAHRRWAEFEDRGHGPRAWLFQIALRVASDTRRWRRRHPVDPDGGVAEERASTEPEQAALVARRRALDLPSPGWRWGGAP